MSNQIAKGQSWYAKLLGTPGALLEVRIIQVTDKTVQLQADVFGMQRFKLEDVEFVEPVPAASPVLLP